MTDTLTPEQVAEFSQAEEAAKAIEAREFAAAAEGGSMPDEDSVKLWHPEYTSLVFGPGRNNADDDPDSFIAFGGKAGLEPHVAVVRQDHPLLKDLLAAYPNIQVLETAKRVYLCPYDDREFTTKFALKGHMGSHRNKPDDAQA